MTSDERALHQLVYQLEAAWNAGDATGFAEAFAEEADFIHILGGYYSGRTAIEAGHRMIFGTIYKGSTVRYSVEKIRFIRPDVVVISARQYLQFYEDGAARELQARPLLVLEKKDGLWEIVTLQNTRIMDVGAPAKGRADAGPTSL
jgi:uncharacterized protein (TIGR02246 family)